MDVLTKPARDFETADISGGDHDFTKPSRYLLIGTAGNLHFDCPGGEFTLPVPAGWNPIVATRIYQANTTAVSITACYTEEKEY